MHRLSTAPCEVVQHIFAYIPVDVVLRYSRLCRHVHRCLADPHFARLCFRTQNRLLKDYEMRVGSMVPTALDTAWLFWPSHFQSLFAEVALVPLTSLIWSSQRKSPPSGPSFGCDKDYQIPPSIPPSIGSLVNLQYLSMSYMSLAGSIPEALFCLHNLIYLDVRHNNLSGHIPCNINGLSQVQRLYLDHNNLTGNIPDSITELKGLHYLSLSHNLLTGRIPESIGLLVELRSLELNDNALTGPLPHTLPDLVKLQHFNCSNNFLSGSMPAGMRRLSGCNTAQTLIKWETDDFIDNSHASSVVEEQQFCSVR
ncbi:hypothetical protein HDU84_008746 [Entophlyctis sp. JEL0112]|nr:hypothetical protein HDU84_008746 [Entophlyctis sp. JEL0112]